MEVLRPATVVRKEAVALLFEQRAEIGRGVDGRKICLAVFNFSVHLLSSSALVKTAPLVSSLGVGGFCCS